jgi:hypothetical protein
MSLSLMLVGMSLPSFCGCEASRGQFGPWRGSLSRSAARDRTVEHRPPLISVREPTGARPVPTLTRSAFSG